MFPQKGLDGSFFVSHRYFSSAFLRAKYRSARLAIPCPGEFENPKVSQTDHDFSVNFTPFLNSPLSLIVGLLLNTLKEIHTVPNEIQRTGEGTRLNQTRLIEKEGDISVRQNHGDRGNQRASRGK